MSEGEPSFLIRDGLARHPLLLAFTVSGGAVGQGSLMDHGHGIHQPRRVREQRHVMAMVADARWTRHGPLSGPVGVRVFVTAKRPKSHYLPVNSLRDVPLLRPNAPAYATSFPDLDKVLRLVGDALTDANVLRDDKIICRWEAIRLYGERASTAVELFDLDREPS